jgi:hypothetical protein
MYSTCIIYFLVLLLEKPGVLYLEKICCFWQSETGSTALSRMCLRWNCNQTIEYCRNRHTSQLGEWQMYYCTNLYTTSTQCQQWYFASHSAKKEVSLHFSRHLHSIDIRKTYCICVMNVCINILNDFCISGW